MYPLFGYVVSGHVRSGSPNRLMRVLSSVVGPQTAIVFCHNADGSEVGNEGQLFRDEDGIAFSCKFPGEHMREGRPACPRLG